MNNGANAKVRALLDRVTQYCMDHVLEIDRHASPLLCVPDASFWLNVLKKHEARGSMDEASWRLCGRVATFVRRHANALTPSDLEQLASERLFTFVAHVFKNWQTQA